MKIRLPLFTITIMVYVILLTGCCYSFKGISIPPDINTFAVEEFNQTTLNAPVNIEVTFAEKLREKVRTESKLRQDTENPDVTFSGSITQYVVTAEAPEEGSTVSLNKLSIGVQIIYKNSKNDKEDYSKSFSFFETFDATQDLQIVEDELIDRIFDQITERIFNDTFTTW